VRQPPASKNMNTEALKAVTRRQPVKILKLGTLRTRCSELGSVRIGDSAAVTIGKCSMNPATNQNLFSPCIIQVHPIASSLA
jgi:hypothetical protein